MNDNPALLPDIDEIHVLVLGYKFGTDTLPTTEVLDVGWHSPIHNTIRVVDEEAVSLVAQAWRALPPAEQARCHTPPYGLRFFRRGETVLEASLCWECRNIFIRIGDETRVYGFDSESEAAQRLLRLAHYLSGRYLEQSGGQIMSIQDVL